VSVIENIAVSVSVFGNRHSSTMNYTDGSGNENERTGIGGNGNKKLIPVHLCIVRSRETATIFIF
jgi:hypothetical protein